MFYSIISPEPISPPINQTNFGSDRNFLLHKLDFKPNQGKKAPNYVYIAPPINIEFITVQIIDYQPASLHSPTTPHLLLRHKTIFLEGR